MSEENNQVENVVAEAAAPEVKKTRVEKLTESYTKKRAQHEKLTAELVEIVAEINAINALSNIGQGSEVLITIGKGDTLTQVKGVVLAVREDEDGKKEFKVAYGSGFDADVKVVGISKLAPIPAAPVEAAAE